jgi:hypothetical protein
VPTRLPPEDQHRRGGQRLRHRHPRGPQALPATPDLTWHTTTQYGTAGTFWRKIAQRTGGSFTENLDGECDHMKIDRRG